MLVSLLSTDAVNSQDLTQGLPNGQAGVERCERILKDDLHLWPQPAQRLGVQRDDIHTVESDFAGSRFNETQQTATERALAAATLPDEGETSPR